jgi:hypothetical protein
MALSCAMEKVMGMLAAGATGSSSALRLKRCRCYINHDHKATHLRPHHDYFDDDCVYPYHTFIDEHDNSFDENYHTVTSIIVQHINYEAPASLTSILQRKAELTPGLMFSHLLSDLIEHMCGTSSSRLMYLFYYIISLLNLLCNFYSQVLCNF